MALLTQPYTTMQRLAAAFVLLLAPLVLTACDSGDGDTDEPANSVNGVYYESDLDPNNADRYQVIEVPLLRSYIRSEGDNDGSPCWFVEEYIITDQGNGVFTSGSTGADSFSFQVTGNTLRVISGAGASPFDPDETHTKSNLSESDLT